MIKICFVIPGFDAGGAQRQCIRLINSLTRLDDFDVHLIYFRDGVFLEELETARLSLYKGNATSMLTFSAFWHVFKGVERIRPNIVFSWLHGADVLVGLTRFLFPNFKWIMAERDSSYPRKLRYMFREQIGKKADWICANSFTGREYWLKLCREASCISVHNNIILNHPPASPLTDKHYDFIFFGRFESQKNIERAVELAVQLAKQRGLKSAFVGDGTLSNKLSYLITQAKVEKHVSIHPFTSDIFEWLNQAKCFLSLSLHEGQPNALLESILAGLIPVVSNIGEHREVLGQNYPFLLDLSDDDEMLAKTATSALSSISRHEILKFANNRLLEMSSCTVTDSYALVFRKLINNDN